MVGGDHTRELTETSKSSIYPHFEPYKLPFDDQRRFEMPVIHREGPYRFSFYSDDRREPVHIHVRRDRNRAKFWLNPVNLAKNQGFGQSELNRIARIIEREETTLKSKWDDYFNE